MKRLGGLLLGTKAGVLRKAFQEKSGLSKGGEEALLAYRKAGGKAQQKVKAIEQQLVGLRAKRRKYVDDLNRAFDKGQDAEIWKINNGAPGREGLKDITKRLKESERQHAAYTAAATKAGKDAESVLGKMQNTRDALATYTKENRKVWGTRAGAAGLAAIPAYKHFDKKTKL